MALLRAGFAPSTPVRVIACYVLLITALFALVWLKYVMPALINNTAPAGLAKTGMVTNPVQVLVAHRLFTNLVRRDVATLLAGAETRPEGVVTAQMLAELPAPLGRYLTDVGVVVPGDGVWRTGGVAAPGARQGGVDAAGGRSGVHRPGHHRAGVQRRGRAR
ncbi:MAG TPA: hypothetical protein VFE42_34275 [Chloroflexota bacterium]|nr:hypothetical protein [Chloroflexota bacterium]